MGSGDRDALLLTAGKLQTVLFGLACHPDPLEQRHRVFAGLVPCRILRTLMRQGDVPAMVLWANRLNDSTLTMPTPTRSYEFASLVGEALPSIAMVPESIVSRRFMVRHCRFVRTRWAQGNPPTWPRSTSKIDVFSTCRAPKCLLTPFDGDHRHIGAASPWH